MDSESEVSALFHKFWDWRKHTNPEFATFCGFHEYDYRLESYDFDSIQEREAKALTFKQDAEKLAQNSDLSDKTKENLNILIAELKLFLKGFNAKGYYFPLNYLEGPHLEFERLISAMKYETLKDYEALLSRFAALPIQISQIIKVMKTAVKEKLVYHSASVVSVPGQLKLLDQMELLSKNPKDCVFYKPFLTLPDSILEDKKKSLSLEAIESITSNVFPAFKKLKVYLEEEYIKIARLKPSISSVPKGKEFYQLCLDFHLGIKMSPEEIHELGLSEMRRISDLIVEVMLSMGYHKKSLHEYTELLRKDERFYYNNSETLLAAYEDIVLNKITPNLKKLFKNIPEDKLKIEPFPLSMADAPMAYYLAGTPDGARSGVFYVNVKDVKSAPRYQMMALALHEALPGHHLQQSYNFRVKDFPEFRKYTEDRKYSEVPSRFPLHSAYVEGWGLYSEFLGSELGLYENRYNYFGYLSQQLFRAARLVVDTGIHAFNWTEEYAVTYMYENTASSKREIENEVKRYITWPGQACAYKVGEIKIKELRQKAETSLGSNFDIRDFHEVVLDNYGSLDVLEEKVLEYIERSKRAC